MTAVAGAGAQAHGEGGAKLGMWLFLLTELLFFSGAFLLYAVFRARYAAGFHAAAADESTAIGTANTLVLLTSSLCMALAIAALRQGRVRASLLGQGATMLLGLVFLAVKATEWAGKIGRGLYPDSPVLLRREHGEVLFFGLYYVLTGIHAVHVAIGIGVIAAAFLLTARGRLGPGRYALLENAGLFWHFVDVVWIYLFPLFYLVT
ncbi:MAG TPA: cytochrome c oxidase subunit 3 [bacterium]